MSRMRGAAPQSGQSARARDACAGAARRRLPVERDERRRPTSPPVEQREREVGLRARRRRRRPGPITPASAQFGASLARHVLEEAAVARPRRAADREHRPDASAPPRRARPARRASAHASAARNFVAKLSLPSTTTSYPSHELDRVLRQEPRRARARPSTPGASARERARGRVELRLPDVGLVEQDLPVQVRRARRRRRRTRPSVPTPARASAIAAGQPSPPTPTTSTRASQRRHAARVGSTPRG